ncbi:MAG: stage III sporulation protein AA [Clostridiaceae bacterium]|nr:stage III sporulation protein AA [Clostridiaceae bacterium]
MQENFEKIFPKPLQFKLEKILKDKELQEIRIKTEKPVIIITSSGEQIIDYTADRDDLKYIMQRISNYSLYAYEEDIRQGFITIRGGHRVGLAGECVMEDGKVKTIKNITSLNIRICREIIGCSQKVMKYIVDDTNIYNTMIISPPKCGKTTILRDIARVLSDKVQKKISIIDERSEIAGSYMGIPQMNVGIRSDILDNCLKSEGMIMAIRSLSPDVLICDEVGTFKEIEALEMAFNSGVNIIVTLHGRSIEDLYNRSVLKNLLNNNILQRVIILGNSKGTGTVENVYSLSEKGEKICLK